MTLNPTHPRMLPLLFACLLAACGGGGGGGGGDGASPPATGSGGTDTPSSVSKFFVSQDALLQTAAVPSGTVLRFGVSVRSTSLADEGKPVPGDLSYRWTFGDGATVDAPWAELVFSTGGSGTISLKVSDAANQSQVLNRSGIIVRPVQLDPMSILVGGPGMRDGGPVARFDTPVALLPATDGGVLVLDKGNSVIRKIADGLVSTVAGVPTLPAYQFGKPGVGRFVGPVAFTRDAQGTVYVADAYRLVKVSPAGAVEPVAGGEYRGDLADAATGLPGARTIAATPDGDLYVADRNTIRLMKSGVATLVAGTTNYFGAPVDGPVAQARFSSIRALAVGDNGDLWIQDDCTRLRRLTRDGRVETVTDPGVPAHNYRCGTGIARAPDGGVYFATPTDVTHVRPDGSTQVAANAAGVDAVAVDKAGILYTARTDEHIVSRHEVGALMTFGLSPKTSGSFPASPQDLTTFAPVEHFGVHPNGDVYFIDKARLCRVGPLGEVGCVAGRSDEALPVDGAPLVARLSNWPEAEVTVDRTGKIYLSDEQTLRRYLPDTGEISTIAGTPPPRPQFGMPPGPAQVEDADGSGAAAALRKPFSLTTDSKGNVYAITNGSRIIRVSPTGTVTTLARHTSTIWPLIRLLVGPDDQVYALTREALFKVVEGGTLSRSEWPDSPAVGTGYSGGPAVMGPDGAIWTLGSKGYVQRNAPTWIERITSTDRRKHLHFGPVRRQIVAGMPAHEFAPSFFGLGIDPQGRLLLSDSNQFGFWRLSEPASPTL